jgi:N-acetylneuraminic acid mutarotase
VLVAGGFNDRGALTAGELYDPRRNRWTSAGDMKPASGRAAAVLLQDGRALVVGGQTYPGAPLANSWLYTP